MSTPKSELESATALMEAQSKHRYAFVFDRLLHRLRRFMRTYPMKIDDVLPEHDVVWVTDLVNGHPAQVILDCIKSHPEIWMDALPQDVCIVSRKSLEQYGLSAEVVNYLADMGKHFVVGNAARYYREREEHEKTRPLGKAG